MPGRRLALDTGSGIRVTLDAVPLPEVVSAEVVDDGTGYGLPPEEGVPQRSGPAAVRALHHAAVAAETVPQHPRLLQVFEAFEEDGLLWVVGEQLPGVPLARLLERGPLPLYRVAEIAGDLLGALHAVHAAGLVHGNITPETVIVCEDGAAMLGGLSTGAAQEALCEGPDADIPGPATAATGWTPGRLRARDTRAVLTGPCAERWAPEQVGPPPDRRLPQPVPDPGSWGAGPAATMNRVAPRPKAPLPGEPVGPAVDCWAVGILLFRALTGHAPFPEADMTALFDAVRAGRRAPAKGCGALRPLVEELLHPDPALRPQPALVQQRLTELLARAPEPYDPDSAAVAELLPAVRPPGTVQRRRYTGTQLRKPAGSARTRDGHSHAAPRRSGPRAGRLGLLMVGGIVLAVLSALVLVPLLAG